MLADSERADGDGGQGRAVRSDDGVHAPAVLLALHGNGYFAPRGAAAESAVEVSTMHCCAPSIRVAVNGETHDLAASERRRFPPL